MPDKLHIDGEGVKPAGRLLRAIKMNLSAPPRIMGVSQFFQRASPADGQLAFKECLQGDDSLLPAQRAVPTSIDAGCRLVEPSCLDVLTAKRGGVAPALQLGRIDESVIRRFLKLV